MGRSKIEWTGHVWNPLRGCSVVSPGCKNCYAMRFAGRFNGEGQPFEGLTVLRSGRSVWSGVVRTVPKMLGLPLRRTKPTLYFVNSMSDLFHESVTNEDIAAIFGVMAATPRHTFQVLTKRPERMVEWFEWVSDNARTVCRVSASLYIGGSVEAKRPFGTRWPLPNVHLGVSVETQEYAESRIPLLLSVPAAVRWISAEPLLGPIDLSGIMIAHPGLDWVVIGGESGPGARPCHSDWMQAIVRQCHRAKVPVYVKQLGARYEDPINGVGGALVKQPDIVPPIRRLRDPKGGDFDEFPKALQVREYPRFASAESHYREEKK